MKQQYHLSTTDAWRMVEAIRDRLADEGKEAAIAVADSQGELLAFLRTDGCSLPSIQIAMNKAYTAARTQKTTRAVGEASRNEGFPMTNYGDIRYLSWGGGVPVIYAGVVVGAIGVSNLSEDEDELLAEHGASLAVD